MNEKEKRKAVNEFYKRWNLYYGIVLKCGENKE